MPRLHRLLPVGLLALLLVGCATSSAPLKTVSHVDLPRYMGDWYVIANIPYFGEKNCMDSIESYALLEDGTIDNGFACRKKSLDAPLEQVTRTRATVHDTTTNAEWRIRFFRVISVKYLILELDPEYQWVAIGHPSRRYGWVLSRSKTLADDTYKGILSRLAGQGYDTSRFVRVPQKPAA